MPGRMPAPRRRRCRQATPSVRRAIAAPIDENPAMLSPRAGGRYPALPRPQMFVPRQAPAARRSRSGRRPNVSHMSSRPAALVESHHTCELCSMCLLGVLGGETSPGWIENDSWSLGVARRCAAGGRRRRCRSKAPGGSSGKPGTRHPEDVSRAADAPLSEPHLTEATHNSGRRGSLGSSHTKPAGVEGVERTPWSRPRRASTSGCRLNARGIQIDLAIARIGLSRPHSSRAAAPNNNCADCVTRQSPYALVFGIASIERKGRA